MEEMIGQTEFEQGCVFIIEKLHRGSVINYRTFFMEDLMHVNIRAATAVTALEITLETLNCKWSWL